jgi:hypothetical protein
MLAIVAVSACAVVLVTGCGAGSSVRDTVWRGGDAQQGDVQLQFASGSDCVMTLAQDGHTVKESRLKWSQDGNQVSVVLADGSVVVFVRDKSILKAPSGGTIPTLFKQNSAVSYSERPLPTGTSAAEAPVADTSGTYDELVTRANGLYDQGSAQLSQDDTELGARYFTAAAAVYAAAWKLQSTDPAVGTDYATSLFYSGDIDAAIRQVDAVIAANSDFPTAWLNKGYFLVHQAKLTEQAGAGSGADLYAQARAALTKAVSLSGDAGNSAVRKAAQGALDSLPQK